MSSSSRRAQHDPLPQGCGMFIYLSAGGRVEGWRHHDEPSHNYKMAAKSAMTIHYPRTAACFIYRRAKEFKKSSSSRRTQRDPLPQGCGMYVLPVCGRKSQVTSSRHIANCYIFARVCFLIYDILEYVYQSTCDKKFSVQLDPYLVQRKYICRIYVSELITTQSLLPYKVVLVSTSMVIVIILLIQHASLQPKTLMW